VSFRRATGVADEPGVRPERVHHLLARHGRHLDRHATEFGPSQTTAVISYVLPTLNYLTPPEEARYAVEAATNQLIDTFTSQAASIDLVLVEHDLARSPPPRALPPRRTSRDGWSEPGC
jgi:hypothetical protein